MHAQRTFAPEGQSVSLARRFVRETLDEFGAEDLTEEAVLATSELVTNAVVHAGTPVRVALDVDPRGLRLEVEDLHPHRFLPLGADGPDDDAEHGRGLFIAAALARAWGVEYSAGSKRVWLRMERDGATPAAMPAPRAARTSMPDSGVAVVELDPEERVRAWNEHAEEMFGWTSQDVLFTSWRDLAVLLDRPAGAGASDAVAWAGQRWQGMCEVRRKSGAPAQVFASVLSTHREEGALVLLVPVARSALLEWPAPVLREAPASHDPLGLRQDALNRLGYHAYLDLVVERARDRLSAHAAYLLLGRELEGDFEVTNVSGLDVALRGTRVAAGDPGAPHVRNPQLPVVGTGLSDSGSSWLAGSGLRSLVVVPVVMEGRVIGALGAGSDHDDGFSDDDAALLQRIANSLAPAADRARLRTSEQERRGWLSFLAETGDLLVGSLDPDMTMAITGQVVVPRLADWCAVYLDDARGRPVLQQVWHRDERAVAPLRAALEAVPADRAGQCGDAQCRGELLSIPLEARGRRIGQLTLGRAEGDPLHGEALVVAESVARRAALAIDNARAHGELQSVGEALQRGLLPATIPTAPAFDVGVVYEAAGERSVAGGDFYDVFPIGGGRWCFAVGDVCGTGAEAAAVTGLARHTIRALVLAGFPVASTLERLNAAILDEGERARFLTLVCGTLEPDSSGRVRLSLVSAGHPLPFVIRRAGVVEQVGRPQSLLGVVDKVAFVADDYVLERGDLLVAVTDGVLERRDGPRMLGEDGLRAHLGSACGLPAQAVAERVRRLVGDFAETPQADDMAVLAIRVAPAGPVAGRSNEPARAAAIS